MNTCSDQSTQIWNAENLRNLGVSEETIEGITRKQTGGQSGRAGYMYEDYYATARLIKAAGPYIDDQRKSLSIKQNEFCLVDDLVIVHNGYEFCQLKISNAETWNRDNSKLTKDFTEQKEICQKCNLKFVLKIVTPHLERKSRLELSIPEELRGCCEVELFHNPETRSELWGCQSQILEVLKELCAYNPNSSGNRELIVVAFFNAWFDVDRDANGYLSIKDVIDYVNNDESIPLRQESIKLPEAWQDAEVLLRSIEGLTVWVEKGFCLFEYKAIATSKQPVNGIVARCNTDSFNRFLERVLSSRPASFEEFMKELP